VRKFKVTIPLFWQQSNFSPVMDKSSWSQELARRLTSEGGDAPRSPIALIEAGTGTGKTVGYTLTAATIAAAREKTLIIATATVALQEQLVLRDLPDIQQQAGMHFSFALAKGRRRYVCLAKLDAALAGQAPATSDFFPG
jgi:ATP-dependent DNA helicase DinG